MKRNSIFHLNKFSFLLFGTGAGLLSLASSTYAQTSMQPPAVILSQADGMVSDCEIDVKESASHDGYRLRVRVPDSISLIELTPSTSSNRSFRIRMDDPASAPATPTINSAGNEGALQYYAQGQAETSIRSPANVMSHTDTSGWQQSSRVTSNGSLQVSAEQSSYPQSNGVENQTAMQSETSKLLKQHQAMRLRTPDSLSPTNVGAAVFPPTTKVAGLQKNKSDGSILVDTGVFENYVVERQTARELKRLENDRQVAFKQTPKVNLLESRLLKPLGFQFESAQTNNPSVAKLEPLNSMPRAFKPKGIQHGRASHMQVSATSEQLNRFAPAAIPTTIRTANADAKQTYWVAPSLMLEPLPNEVPSETIAASHVEISRQMINTQQMKQPEFDHQTGPATDPVSIFIEGPETLDVNQAGNYQIAVVNSSSRPTSVRSIKLRIPDSAEMLVIERDAQIDDLERTLTWKIDELASGEQQRIRFRLKIVTPGEVNFPIIVSQEGRGAQTISQATIVK